MSRWRCPFLGENTTLFLPNGAFVALRLLPDQLQWVAELLHEIRVRARGEEPSETIFDEDAWATADVRIMRVYEDLDLEAERSPEQTSLMITVVTDDLGDSAQVALQQLIARYGKCLEHGTAEELISIQIHGTYEEVDVHEVVNILAEHLTIDFVDEEPGDEA